MGLIKKIAAAGALAAVGEGDREDGDREGEARRRREEAACRTP